MAGITVLSAGEGKGPARPQAPGGGEPVVLGGGGLGGGRDSADAPVLDRESADVLDGIFEKGEGEGAAPPVEVPAPVTREPAAPPAAEPPDLELEPVAAPAAAAPEVKPSGFDEKAFDAETQRMAQEVRPDRKSQDTFKLLRNQLKEANRKLAEAATTAVAPAVPADQGVDVEAMKAQLAEYEEKLGRIDLTQSRGFQQEFVVPVRTMMAEATQVMTRYGGFTDQAEARKFVTDLFDAPAEEQQQQLRDLPTQVQGYLVGKLAAHAEIQTARQAAETNWKAKMASMSEQEQRNAQLATARQLADSVEQVLSDMRGARNLFFTPNPANREHTAAVEQRVQQFRGVMESGNMPQVARLVAEGLAYQALVPHYKALQAQYRKLKQDAEAVLGRRPAVRTAGEDAGGAPRTKIETPDDVASNIWGG